MTDKNKREELGELVAGTIEPFNYRLPAISITERIGGKEVVREFATSDDYRAWKSLQDQ